MKRFNSTTDIGLKKTSHNLLIVVINLRAVLPENVLNTKRNVTCIHVFSELE